MYILIGLLIFMVIVLVILGFISTSKSYPKIRKKEEPQQQKDQAQAIQQDTLIPALEEQLFSAKDELEKLRADYINIQEELEATKKREAGLREELIKQKQWYDKKAEGLEKLKNNYAQFQEKLTIEEKQLEKEFMEDVGLNREIKEKDDIIESLKKRNKEMADEIQTLRAQIEGHNKET